LKGAKGVAMATKINWAKINQNYITAMVKIIGVNDRGMEGMYPLQYLKRGDVVCHIPPNLLWTLLSEH